MMGQAVQIFSVLHARIALSGFVSALWKRAQAECLRHREVR